MSRQVIGGCADLWELMVVSYTRVVGSGGSKRRSGLGYMSGAGIRPRENNYSSQFTGDL